MLKVAIGSSVIAYEDIGDGAPLVMLHGGQGSRMDFVNDFVPYLKEGIRSLPYDQRDSGETTNEPVPYSMADQAADCAGFIKALGLERAHVTGGSYGGIVALHVAIEHPECVRSLILRSTSPGGAVGAEDLANVKTRTAELDRVELPVRLRLMLEDSYTPQYIDEHPEVLERAAGWATSHTPEQMQRRLAASFEHDVCDSIGQIRAPTLIIHGSDDPLLRLPQAEWMANQIPGAALVVFEGMRHGLNTEQPERLAALVQEFVLAHEPD